MKRLAKILAVFALVIIGIAFARSYVHVLASDPDLCPGPGNNLIDNISPNVLINLRRDFTGPTCWLTATFLFRPNDLSSPNLKDFFTTAKEQRIFPVIRVASNNSGDQWPAIDPTTAAADANFLRAAATGFPKVIPVELGNEINLGAEWGGAPDPNSYADSFIAFANAAFSGSLKVILPPLSLSDPNAGSYYQQLYQALTTKLPAVLSCNPQLETCKTAVQNWLNDKINGYGLNLYANAGDYNSIIGDKNRVISALQTAGFNIDPPKDFIITEIGLPGGVYEKNAGLVSCLFFRAVETDSRGSQFLAATIFSRDSQSKVRSFYFSSGSCGDAVEYDKSVINLGGSTSFGNGSGYPPGKKIYPPLGSLEECPPAISTNSQSCVPTSQNNSRCVSECSQPLDIVQNLYLIGGSSCGVDGRNCHADIKIRNNSFQLPYAHELADYFAGTLDSENTPPEKLDALQQALREGYSNPLFQEAFDKVGVARKLFPKEVQDDLRCKFIDYVKNTPNSKHRTLVIDGKSILDIPCSPDTVSGWSKIPLFPDDNSQGKIEFVSPSLLIINPISVSLPDIQRLNGVTKTIQSLLIPPEEVQKNIDPTTYGKTIEFKQANSSPVCSSTINCQRDNSLGSGFHQITGKEATVQVRTVFPHFYDISEQTISFLRGFLHVFRPGEDQKLTDSYQPIPASTGNIKYELTGSSGLAIDDSGHQQNGW